MDGNNSFGFKDFVVANAEHSVSGFDYIHTIYKSQNLPTDFILWFGKLFFPEFKVVDGKVYIAELFDASRYQSLLDSGRNLGETQYWMNLIEVTGLFDDMPSDDALKIAELLVRSWNLKLASEFSESSLLARTICDNGTGEIFVTVEEVES